MISALNNAGTEAVVMNYYRHIDRSKIQFDFLVLNTEKGFYEKEITELGGKIFKIPSFRQNPIKCARQRKKFFKENKYDIVEVHSPSALRYAYCKLAKKSGAKVIFHIHSISNKAGFLIRYARRQIEKYCDETVTCSQEAANSVLGKNADKVVFNAIDYDKYKFNEEKRNIIREYYRISDKDCVIGHIGRYTKVKNQTFLLKVFKEIIQVTPNLRLLLKGFGDLEEEIKEFIKENGLENEVILADDKFTVAELYNAFDLFVLPSLYEGLPVVAIEAQANGLRCVVSENVTKEMDISKENTFLELDINKWAKAINQFEFKRLSEKFVFSTTGYDIENAAMNRQKDYLKFMLE